MNVPDNYDRWKQHDTDQQEQLDKLPRCEYCDNTIQDDYYYDLGHAIICENCLNEHFRKDIEDYVG